MMMKIVLLTLAAVAVGQVVLALDVGDVAKWRQVNFEDKSEIVQTVKTVLKSVADEENIEIVSVQSFASRPLMIGREYRTIYQGLSKTVSLITNASAKTITTVFSPSTGQH